MRCSFCITIRYVLSNYLPERSVSSKLCDSLLRVSLLAVYLELGHRLWAMVVIVCHLPKPSCLLLSKDTKI